VEEENVTDTINTREIVLDMLLEVLEEEQYSHTVLKRTLKRYQQHTKQERAFLSYLYTGTVKSYLTLDYVINRHASLPVHKMKPLIRNLLRLSVYQLIYMEQIPQSAVCNEAVKLTKKRGFAKLSGFINGVLRSIAREGREINYPDKEKTPTAYLEVKYSIPEWLVQELLQQYSFSTVEAMLEASLKEKETSIRCNEKKIAPEQLKSLLIQEGITVEDSEYLKYAFKIRNYDYLEKSDAFQQGLFAIQDVSSMLVCEVAGIRNTDFVLDLCAAPGGKTLHAAQHARKVLARDLTEYKIKLVEENITRMGFTNVETQVWDATILDQQLMGQADVVIADLPCSGLGVMGKKSDIKYKLTRKQLSDLVELQRKILALAEKYVKSQGLLIFSTCTVNKEENEYNRSWFLDRFDYRAESLNDYLPEELKSDTTEQGYLQLIQGMHNSDGFFIAKFRKK
jgi:16S rRNA (cytosine967-C5)-methyltransferase